MRIAWIGTGVMGQSMAGHLLDAGHELIVFTRTREKADGLLQRGAKWSPGPKAAARDAEIVCIMVGHPRDVRQVALGPGGALRSMRPGTLLIDFTTSSPALARRIAAEAAERGVSALDAPVSGGDTGARNAALSIMAGGEESAFERARPLFERLGKTIVLHGPAGAGQHAKMVNQIMIASNMIGVCEGLLYARRAGLNPELVLASVGSGAAASWSLSNLAPRILRNDLEPGFYVEHFLKDLKIALEEARRMKMILPGLALARRLYARLTRLGAQKKGTQALVLALEDLQRTAGSGAGGTDAARR